MERSLAPAKDCGQQVRHCSYTTIDLCESPDRLFTCANLSQGNPFFYGLFLLDASALLVSRTFKVSDVDKNHSSGSFDSNIISFLLNIPTALMTLGSSRLRRSYSYVILMHGSVHMATAILRLTTKDYSQTINKFIKIQINCPAK